MPIVVQYSDKSGTGHVYNCRARFHPNTIESRLLVSYTSLLAFLCMYVCRAWKRVCWHCGYVCIDGYHLYTITVYQSSLAGYMNGEFELRHAVQISHEIKAVETSVPTA